MGGGRFSGMYTSGALMLTNVLVLFIVINLAAQLLLDLHESFSQKNPVEDTYGKERLALAYPGEEYEAVSAMLHEAWSRPYLYEPFTQFKERPFQGLYVNVDENGFRRCPGQGDWPPPADALNIYLFGGSTTFGYGVEDSQTIGCQLQDYLRHHMNTRVNVYNFGRGFYFSTQERILLESLLIEGRVPDVAVFVDGLNDFYHFDGTPLYTERLSEYISGGARRKSVAERLPVVKLTRLLQGKEGEDAEAMETAAGDVHYDDADVLDAVINRYLVNRRMIEAIASEYDFETLFVWQPVPTYKYDTRYHPFVGSGFGRHRFSGFGYPRFRQQLEQLQSTGNFLWAADIQEDIAKSLYVDKMHYSGEFSGMIADVVAAKLLADVLQ